MACGSSLAASNDVRTIVVPECGRWNRFVALAERRSDDRPADPGATVEAHARNWPHVVGGDPRRVRDAHTESVTVDTSAARRGGGGGGERADPGKTRGSRAPGLCRRHLVRAVPALPPGGGGAQA